MTTLAVGAIGVYRRYLSPLKGFSRAHNALHRSGSCSDFGLKVYQRHGWTLATAMLRRRLQVCRMPYGMLLGMAAASTPAKEPASSEDEQPRLKKQNASGCDALDALNCLSFSHPGGACLDFGACDCLSGLSI